MTMRDEVAYILKFDPMSRNHDGYLYYQWLLKYRLLQSESLSPDWTTYDAFNELGSVRRLRQKFQEEGKYLAHPEVRKKRAKSFQKMLEQVRKPIDEWF